MKQVSVLLLSTTLVLFTASVATAKHVAPADVAPVQHAGIEYRAPHNMLGCVEAWDTVSKKRIWFRQIYVVQRDPSLESDVQDVFITAIEVDAKRNVLQVTNEEGGVFALNLKTLNVKTLMGEAVIKRR